MTSILLSLLLLFLAVHWHFHINSRSYLNPFSILCMVTFQQHSLGKRIAGRLLARTRSLQFCIQYHHPRTATRQTLPAECVQLHLSLDHWIPELPQVQVEGHHNGHQEGTPADVLLAAAEKTANYFIALCSLYLVVLYNVCELCLNSGVCILSLNVVYH